MNFLSKLVRRGAHDRLSSRDGTEKPAELPLVSTSASGEDACKPASPSPNLVQGGQSEGKKRSLQTTALAETRSILLHLADWQRATEREDFLRVKMCGSWGLCTYLACWCTEEHIGGRDEAFQLLIIYIKRQQTATSKPNTKQETSEDSRSKVYTKAHNYP